MEITKYKKLIEFQYYKENNDKSEGFYVLRFLLSMGVITIEDIKSILLYNNPDKIVKCVKDASIEENLSYSETLELDNYIKQF